MANTLPYRKAVGIVTCITNKPKVVQTYISQNNTNFTNPPSFNPETSLLLDQAWKYGGYRKMFGKYFWLNKKIKYFNFEQEIFGGLPQFIKSAELLEFNNVSFEPAKNPPNEVSKYTFKIKRKKSDEKFDLDSAFTFNLGGAETFQHFIQDCLPIIAMSKDFIVSNPAIVILIEKPNSNFKTQELLIRSLGIKNKIINTSKDKIIIKNLYYWNFKPFNARLVLPFDWYEKLYETLHEGVPNNNLEYLTLITRNESTRNFKDENLLSENLSNLSKKLNLKFIKIDSNESDVGIYQNILPRTKILIAMHGGACFNSIYLSNKSIFFEFIPTQNTNTTLNFISGLGIKYVPIPLEFNLTQMEPVPIGQENLGTIFDMAETLLKNYS
jgi:hypothetical protein